MEITVVNIYLMDPWGAWGTDRIEWLVCKPEEVESILSACDWAQDPTIDMWWEIEDHFTASDFVVGWKKEEVI